MPENDLVDRAVSRLRDRGLLPSVRSVYGLLVDDVATVVVEVDRGLSIEVRDRIERTVGDLRGGIRLSDGPSRGDVRDGRAVIDGRPWAIGTPRDVAWIGENTVHGRTIDAAIPLLFDAYATVLIREGDEERQASDTALLRLLARQSPDQPWWLGYLDTGAHDIVVPRASRVLLYARWPYVILRAGPDQAGSWRADDAWRGRLPDLIFPADRSWLVSMLWDDDWRCVGGPRALLDAIAQDPALRSRAVLPGQDATPPGHVAL